MVLPLMVGAYGLYSAYNIYSEARFLRDYKRRYPHVRIKYGNKTGAYKALGSALGVASMSYGWYRGLPYGVYSGGRSRNGVNYDRMYG